MAEELKAEELKAEEATRYKQVLPSGLAAEIASEDGGRLGDPAALGRWLKERLETAGVPPERLAGLSGVTAPDMAALLEGHSAFPLDPDHLQRFATALVELHVVTDPSQLWEAAGFAEAEYIVPPAQIVQSMSGTA